MKQFKMITILMFSLLISVGCDTNFEEINTDPNNPVTVPSSLLMPGVIRTAQNSLNSTFIGGDMGACWAHQYAKVQYNDEERYLPRQSVISSIWDSWFASNGTLSTTGVISDSNAMYNIALTEENENMQAVAITLQAYGYAFLTDVYGNIPFTEAMKAGTESNFAPAYDTQETVYAGILSMLDTAIGLYGSNGAIDSTNDILYAGDVDKWKKFASSLKFRVLMRASGKMNVAADLQALVNAGNLFSNNDDEAKLVYLSASPSANPLYESVVFGTRGEWKINSVVVDMLTLDNDPRLPIYADPNEDGVIRGKPAGLTDVPSDEYNYANVSPIGAFYLRPELPGFFISNPELKFLMAEAAVKGYISGDATAYFLEAIAASLIFNEVGSLDAAAFMDGKGLNPDPAAALQQIATQNWIALYSQGVEAWTEWRRTKFPILEPALEAELDEIPSRYTYPTDESSINRANYEAAVAEQGDDKLTTPIWWMN